MKNFVIIVLTNKDIVSTYFLALFLDGAPMEKSLKISVISETVHTRPTRYAS